MSREHRFGVFTWHESPIYYADEAIRTYAVEKAADTFARANNYVVRELKYTHPTRPRPLSNPIGKKLHVKPLPAVALDIGDFVAVIYRSRRDGNLYRHEFAARSRPLLAVSQDGTQLLVLGGAYRFTSRGIVDV